MSLRSVLLLAMSYLLVLALVAFGIPLALSVRQRVDTEVRSQARSAADVVAISAAALAEDGENGGSVDRTAMATLAARGAGSVRGRVVIVDARGVVLADSSGPAAVGANYTSRPEIAQALTGGQVQERRRSDTLGQDILVTSAPVVVDGRRAGAVRITQGVGAVQRAVRRNILGLALVGGFVLLLGLGVAILLARRLSAPLRQLQDTAVQVAAGDLEVRAIEAGPREQQELARSFNVVTARVSRALEAQRDFVADASHHLRTPLTGLRLRLETLGGEHPGPGLVAATEELDRLSRTVDELLILSTTGERDAPGEAVALAARARAVVARWEPAAAERDQELTLAQVRPSATVFAAVADIDRALDVLVDNALRYAPPSSTVTVTLDQETIAVADEGPGLSAQDEEVLFTRFVRGSAGHGGPTGTGLGLAIARELAGRWGGEATLTNGPTGGAVARLTFPGAA